MNSKLQDVFRKVFRDPNLQVERTTTNDNVKNWDSLTHIQLMVEIEEAFNIRFTTRELTTFRTAGEIEDAVLLKQGTKQ
jgi:acyl carrier protein